ncbi:MAG TPA: L,D-transpeptidase [Candidatus Saccharimonadales bacterium]|nr:L,D-transpeptidase [Candidatus Saccharimonadales bacterium]
MNRMAVPVAMVGNDFALPKPGPKKRAMKVEASIPALSMSPQEVLPSKDLGGIEDNPNHKHYKPAGTSGSIINLFHQHTFIIAAISLLIIGGAATKLGATYWSAKYIPLASANTAAIKTGTKPVSGFNLTIPAASFQAKLQSITGQPVSLTVGQYSEQVDSNMIKSWLQVTANKDKSEYYIHVNEAAMSNSLVKEAGTYARSSVNQVTVNEDGANVVAVAGKNGRALSDPNGLKTQAQAAAKNVLASKGLQFNTPLSTTPFQAVTAANFGKLLVSNVTTKKLWAYQNGQLVNTFLVSAGKPSTPTPLGEYHIYAKFTVQDMRGSNADGSTYFQPRVPWVNYFYSGSAVHGVYWHPLTWFGNINSSHGCIGLPVDQAKWVFDWAPIGTTVIVNS